MRLLLNTIMLEVNRWTQDKALTRPLAALLEPIKAAEFSELEIWQYHISQLHRDEIAALKGQLDDLGLQTVALGAYPLLHLEGAEAEGATADLDQLIDYAEILGVTTFKIFPGRLASADTDQASWQRSTDRLRNLAARLAQSGMDLTLETHGNTLCDTQESTQRLLADLGTVPNLGLCFQPYTDQGTEETLAFFDALGSSIRHIHLQNRSSADNTWTLLAEGDWYDCARLLQRAKTSGFDGLLSLEFTAGLFPPEGEAFDPQTVIDNAVQDSNFVLQTWNA
ncbi:MAG: sugar phosphate isomerase/epimerase family protein [Candidatus Latescibacterota bacterium]|nr:sugar phosphate isomerase/epimerase family protein [Candidatus Latescibacterota bacterium]